VRETGRLYGVLNKQLAEREFIAGDDYSIADMASYPWVVPHLKQAQDLNDFPHLQRWFAAIGVRPATQRAYAIGAAMKEAASNETTSEETWKLLYGQSATTIKT
jgi:GST-like protein